MNKVYCATDIGHIRHTNEDSYAIIPPSSYLVADGMGGYAAGEVASRMAVDTVREILTGKTHLTEESLRHAITDANTKIVEAARDTPEYHGMGTTATLLSLCHSDETQSKIAIWAHVGDSRLYLYRKNHLQQITKDHSYVESLVELGEISEEEAHRHPNKNMLTRAVGIQDGFSVDTGHFFVEAGDVFLLATDGLTNMLDTADIAKILGYGGNMAYELVEAALKAGGYDNITAVAVVYGC